MKFAFTLLVLLVCALPLDASKLVSSFESEGMQIEAVQLLANQDVIWGFDFISSDRIIFSERDGDIYIFNIKDSSLEKLLNIPEVRTGGQGGLLDLRLHPRFNTNKYVYITYSFATAEGGTTRLARSKLNGNQFGQWETLFTANAYSKAVNHYGSRIVFAGNDIIFVSIGERTERDLAQSLKTHHGTIVRLHENGSTPSDNPFVDNKDALSEIWSYGHRNPQGLAIHPETKQLWENEHGPRGGDEINLIKKGANYGWPIITYGREYYGPKIGDTHKEGMLQPLKVWTPSIAPSSLAIYSGKVFQKWKNNFFSGALAMTHLSRIEMGNGQPTDEEKLLEELKERIRNVGESPDGKIYVSTDSGKLIRLQLADSKN